MDRLDEQPQTFRRRSSPQTVSSQLSLFDLIEDEDVAVSMAREAERLNNIRPAFSISQEIIDTVLCDGTNANNSVLEIAAEFSKGKPLKDKVDFLKDHYKTDGKGFILDDKQISAWWNEDGITISYGNTVETSKKHTLSWEDAAMRIDELLDMGRFASSNILLQIDDYIYTKTAENFWYMYKDLNYDDYPELRDLFTDKAFERKGGFPEDVKRLKEFFKTSAGLDMTKTAVQKICDMRDEGKDVTRFWYINPHETNKMLEDLYIVRKQYTSQSLSYVPPARFITEEEITKLLLKGTGRENGRYHIYRFFTEHSDKQERQQFLKNEYGIGGSYNHISNESHDAKGIKFSHGDLMQPYAQTLLKWNEVERRIDKLINQGIYLSKKDIENIPNYEKGQIANSVRSAFMNVLDESRYKPYPNDKGFFVNETNSYIIEKLDNHEQMSEMMSELRNLLMETPKDDKWKFNTRTKALEMLESYSNGTFNLFPSIDRPTVDAPLHKDPEQESFADFYARIHSEDDGKTVALFPVGDFYEAVGTDAEQISETLDFRLTHKTIEDVEYPMCGFPKHRLEENVNVLTEKGFDVILVDEDRNPHKVISREKALGLPESTAPAEVIEEPDEDVAEETPEGLRWVEETAELVGKEITIDDRKFIVDSVNNDFGTVSLKDVTFQDNVGFPIFRRESVDFVKAALEQQKETEKIVPEFEKVKPSKVANTVVYPEIPMAKRTNFVIDNDELGYGGAKEKFGKNMEAIRVL